MRYSCEFDGIDVLLICKWHDELDIGLTSLLDNRIKSIPVLLIIDTWATVIIFILILRLLLSSTFSFKISAASNRP